jgi:hypothetical protein
MLRLVASCLRVVSHNLPSIKNTIRTGKPRARPSVIHEPASVATKCPRFEAGPKSMFSAHSCSYDIFLPRALVSHARVARVYSMTNKLLPMPIKGLVALEACWTTRAVSTPTWRMVIRAQPSRRLRVVLYGALHLPLSNGPVHPWPLLTISDSVCELKRCTVTGTGRLELKPNYAPRFAARLKTLFLSMINAWNLRRW